MAGTGWDRMGAELLILLWFWGEGLDVTGPGSRSNGGGAKWDLVEKGSNRLRL